MEDKNAYQYSGPYSIKRTDSGKIEYDMYEVKIISDDGVSVKYNVFVEPNTFDVIKGENPEKQKQLMEWFLVKRLIVKGGLIEQQDNRSYIYAGRMEKNNGRYSADSFVLVDPVSNLTKRKIFDDELPELVESLEEKTVINNTPQVQGKEKKTGKTYAVSDIHGMYGSYIDVMSNLNPNDTLYIIGDVIDRGKNGIKIIEDIMERQKNSKSNPTIVFLCGNHEYTFLECVRVFNEIIERCKSDNPTENVEDIIIASKLCRYMEIVVQKERLQKEINNIPDEKNKQKGLNKIKSKHDLSVKQKTIEGYEHELNEILNRYLKNTKLSEYELAVMKWMIINKVKDTFLNFRQLDFERREKIIRFIENSYVSYTEHVGNRRLLLLHAMPPYEEQNLRKIEAKNYRLGEFTQVFDERVLDDILQARNPRIFIAAKNHGYETIYGHDPENDGKVHRHPEDGSIMIDAGCGHGGNLALYCMDDDSIQYFKEKEDVIERQSITK